MNQQTKDDADIRRELEMEIMLEMGMLVYESDFKNCPRE